jgi:signal transduction histidine kinase
MNSGTLTNQRDSLAKAILLSIICLFAAIASFSQHPDTVISVDKDSNLISFARFTAGILRVDVDIETAYHKNIISQKPQLNQRVATIDVSKKIVQRFTIANNSQSPDSLYFFPGFFFEKVNLYKVEDEKAFALPSITPPMPDNISFRMIGIPANDTVTILAECFPVRTYTSSFRPRLIRSDYLETFAIKAHMSKQDVTVFTYILCGLFGMMILFSLATFFQDRNTEFLYYAGYAAFLGVMLFTKQYYFGKTNETNFFFESYLDFILQGTGILFFMLFMVGFLETKRNFPFLHKVYLSGIVFVPVMLLIYTFIHYTNIDYYWENFIENVITKIILLLLIVIFLVYAVKNWHHKLLRYLFWGNALFLVFSLGSLVFVLNRDIFSLPGILDDPLVLYEIGLLIELIFFLMGLAYKNKKQLIEQTTERARLKMENERKELEKQVAVMQAHQEERERISADIHDELGSGMTTIRLMSEIAKNKMKENVPVEVEKISNSANEVLNKMNAIIWSMNSSNDTLDSLISYIRAYAIEFFDATPIECKVTMPAVIQLKEISGDKRRNIFLCVKESLNNVLKHSRAGKVNIAIEAACNLTIVIADNGVGIEPEKTRRLGNGLRNIERRMNAIGGNYQIRNNGGTESILDLPL